MFDMAAIMFCFTCENMKIHPLEDRSSVCWKWLCNIKKKKRGGYKESRLDSAGKRDKPWEGLDETAARTGIGNSASHLPKSLLTYQYTI